MGSQATADELIVAHLPRIRHIANRVHARLGPRGAIGIEDLVSAGVLALLRSIERYDPRRGANLQTYSDRRLFGAMIDEYRRIDGARKRRRLNVCVISIEQAPVVHTVPDPSPDPLSCAIESEERARLAATIPEIPSPDERYVLQRYFGSGGTLKEISRELGVGMSRVSELKASGVNRLRELLAA